ncbi:MAG TPA: hypothetical protein VH500_18745 [Nitrososphaeraceae archaeon]|jgi:hypothetical protein
MKQKRLKDKRWNTINLKNKRTATSAAYRSIKSNTKHYQKSNCDDQTDNKEINRNIDTSMGLGENKKRIRTMDQKQENSSSPTLPASSSLLPEVFDSSRDNAMSEMKEVADMSPDETIRVFSDTEGELQLDPSNITIKDTTKEIDREINLNTTTDPNPNNISAMVDSILQERDPSARGLIEADMMPTQNVKLDNITQVYKESEKQGHLVESDKFDGNDNEESSNLLNNYYKNTFVIGIRFWQAHYIAWINAYNEFLKVWVDSIKTSNSNSI